MHFYRKNNLKYTDSVVLKFENSWFMKTKFIPKSKHQALKKKYSEKIVKIVSEKNYDEETSINNLMKLVNDNKNELIQDLDNLKKENNYFLIIKDTFKGYELPLCINIKKNKEEKTKLCVRIKENGFFDLCIDQEEVIAYIKQEISMKYFGG